MNEPERMPQRVTETADRRAAERDHLHQLAELRWTLDGEPRYVTGIVEEFSLRGLRFRCSATTRDRLRPGCEVTCKLLLPARLPGMGGRALTCEGRVARIADWAGEGSQVGIAVAVHAVSLE